MVDRGAPHHQSGRAGICNGQVPDTADVFGFAAPPPVDNLDSWDGIPQVEAETQKVEQPHRLRDAVRQARIESAERTGVVVDLRDAELARLELLNDALDPLFGEIPGEIELFDRGVSRGDTPRLCIDVIAHVEMGRDKRLYRFVQDTRYGRKVLTESFEIPEVVQAVTKYVARRLVERERALAEEFTPILRGTREEARFQRRRRRWRAAKAFVFGLCMGVLALFVLAWVLAAQQH